MRISDVRRRTQWQFNIELTQIGVYPHNSIKCTIEQLIGTQSLTAAQLAIDQFLAEPPTVQRLTRLAQTAQFAMNNTFDDFIAIN